MTNHENERDEVGEILRQSYEAPVPEARSEFVETLRSRLQQESEVPPQKSRAGVLMSFCRRPWVLGTAAAVVLAFGVWLAVRPGQKNAKSEPSVTGPLAAAPAAGTSTPRDPTPLTNDLDPMVTAAPAERARMDDPMDTGALLLPTETPKAPVATRLAEMPAPAMSVPLVGMYVAKDPGPPTPAPPEVPTQFEQAVATRSPAGTATLSFPPATAPAAAASAATTNTLMPAFSITEIDVPLLRSGRDIRPDDHPKSVSREPAADKHTMTIEIEAFVDGKDYLIIRGDTLQWRHEAWAAVGRHEGFDEPTIISTRKAGSATLDRVRWFPEWRDWRGKPIPPRATPSMSPVFSGLTPLLPAREMRVELTPLTCRNPVRVEQQPCADNGYTLIIGFDDTDLGAVWYKVRLTITEIERRTEGESAGPDRTGAAMPKAGGVRGVVFVSDMPWLLANAGAGNPVRRDININGQPIGIAGRMYAKGIWTHSYPDETPADVVIDVSNRGFAAFLADAGVEQSSDSGSAQFQVLVDGEKRAESPVMRPGAVHRFLVDVTGVRQVTLRVLNGGDGYNGDHAAWGAPRFAETANVEPAGPSARALDTAIPGLAAHYPLDGDAKDTSGNGNHGVEHGAIAYGPGRYHLAARFDGVDDFIEIPNSDLLNPASTVAFWVKLTENGNYSFVSKAVVGNGYGIWLGRDANFNQGVLGSGLVGFGFDGKGVQWNWRMITAETPLRPDTWHHIAAVLGESGQRLYIDGKEAAFNPSVEKPSIDRRIWLGREMRLGGGFLNGLLDEIRIYDRGLSGNEVRQLYRGGQ